VKPHDPSALRLVGADCIVVPPQGATDGPVAPLFGLLRTSTAAQHQTGLTAPYADRLQLHYGARRAELNVPDPVMAQVRKAGPGGSSLSLHCRGVYGYGNFGVNRKRVETWLGGRPTRLPPPSER